MALPNPRHSNEPTRRRKTIPYIPCPRNTIHQRKNKEPRRTPYRPGLSPHSWNTNHNNPTPTGEVSKSQHHRQVQPSLKQKHAPTKNEQHLNANTRHHPAHPGASSFKNHRATSSRHFTRKPPNKQHRPRPKTSGAKNNDTYKTTVLTITNKPTKKKRPSKKPKPIGRRAWGLPMSPKKNNVQPRARPTTEAKQGKTASRKNTQQRILLS